MCVSVLLVLGDKIRPEIDEQVQAQWFMSYLGNNIIPRGFARLAVIQSPFTNLSLYLRATCIRSLFENKYIFSLLHLRYPSSNTHDVNTG